MTTDASNIAWETDIIIIGSGAAGLTLALRSAPFAQVMVLSKCDLKEGATFYAQGALRSAKVRPAAPLPIIRMSVSQAMLEASVVIDAAGN